MELTGAFLEHLHREQQSNQRQYDLDKAAGLLSKLFLQQRDFVEDKSRQKVALCPRRSGKSYSVLSYALITALRKPGAKIVVIAKVRRQVKGVYWSELKRICAHNEIKAHYRNVELECELANGSTILFTGADTMEVMRESHTLPTFSRN
jgi:phage terminase large subunit